MSRPAPRTPGQAIVMLTFGIGMLALALIVGLIGLGTVAHVLALLGFFACILAPMFAV